MPLKPGSAIIITPINPIKTANHLKIPTFSLSKKIDNISVSSTKSQTGHLLGAAGAIEAIFSILSIKNQIIPATMNLENPLEHNKVEIIREKPKKSIIKNVLSNSFGFGGTNVSLTFKNLN